jgi:hypothetical protein
MLNTENISTESRLSKTILPGNVIAKINDITIEAPVYDLTALHVILHLETVEQTGDFEGFLIDKDNPAGPRYKGQIGHVKASYFPYKDGVAPKTGTIFNRDQSILKTLAILAKALGKSAELNAVSASVIEQYIPLAAKVLSGDKFLKWCVAGKEYDNKQGFTNYDLYLPKSELGKYAFEQLSASPSKVLTFNEGDHIKKKTAAAQVNSFAPAADLSGNALPAPNISAPNEDFDLPF